ncbi:hypothetical protein [Burkholderia multivorans]|uniref:hypothetical protein n=1 Tax=Burkholderia multivorans TaxID=87883 RepID=UPI00158968F9|nr:hypothetical protein [Burkholderia multivorans]
MEKIDKLRKQQLKTLKAQQGYGKSERYYVYLVHHADTGFYYYGCKSTNHRPEQDNYWGSGVLLWNLYRMQGYNSTKDGKPEGWSKHIIKEFTIFKDALRYEKSLIKADSENGFCLNLSEAHPSRWGTRCAWFEKEFEKYLNSKS